MKYFDKIEAYFEGELNAADKVQFEQDLLTTPALKEEYDAYQASLVALEMMTRDEGKIAEIKPKNSFNWWGIAAGILLLITAGIFVFANFNYSNAQIANKHYQQPNIGVNIRGEQSALQTANKAFAKGAYNTVIQTLANKTDLTSEEQYMLAHAYFGNQHYTEATTLFQTLINQNTSRKEGAEWFLALAYLGQDDSEKAQEMLNTIVADTSHPNYDKASALSKELSIFWRKLVF